MGNISIYKQDQLDIPTKSFEVAFRSYIARRILAEYPNKDQLRTEFANQVAILKQSEAILSYRIKSALEDSIKGKKWEAFWDNLQFMDACNQAQSHTDSHDVFYLSLSVTLTFAFKRLFEDLIQAFPNPADYVQKANSYYEVRNALSHRASRQISSVEANDAITFMRVACNVIGDEFFWYKSKASIAGDIDKYQLDSKPFIAENLDDIPFSENEIVCREPEFNALFKCVCNWDGHRKMLGGKRLLCIAGYGGIGKTALVTEFVKRLLAKMVDETYEGLRPEFILFYSAKERKLDFDQETGKLQNQRVHKQFSNFSELKCRILEQLNISSFPGDWNHPGILIIDNLETLDNQSREDLLNFIDYDLPQCIRVILTTRIPEEADKLIKLKGFQADEGLLFMREYIERNGLDITLDENQIKSIVEYSYGNPLVLVLALKRLSAGVIKYPALIKELKVLPSNANRSVGSFMYQNTIEEIKRNHSGMKDAIEKVLQSMSIYEYPLDKEILASAHALDVELIEEILEILAKYLVIERAGDGYVINNFANEFVLVSMSIDSTTKASLRQKILTAVNESRRNSDTLAEYLEQYSALRGVITDWLGDSEKDCFAIAKAFVLYEDMKRINQKNADYEIQQCNMEFEGLIQQNSAHPYVYYQRARMLLELRINGLIHDEYNSTIEDDFSRCLMLIDDYSFRTIKKTQTYPSILWIYSIFLNSTNKHIKAAQYAEEAVGVFRNLGIKTNNYYDALAMQGIIELTLYAQNIRQVQRLKIARANYQEIIKNHAKPKHALDPINGFTKHLNQLMNELDKYASIKTR